MNFFKTLLLAVLPFGVLMAQQTTSSTDIKKKLSGIITLTDSIANKQQNFTYLYTLNGTGEEKVKFESTASVNDSWKPEITISPSNETAFSVEMYNIFNTKNPHFKPSILREQIMKMLAKIAGVVEIVEDESLNTAKLKLLKSTKLPIYLTYEEKLLNSSTETIKKIEVAVEKVDIEFEDGLIKNVIVEAKLPRQADWDEKENGIIVFRNNRPIGTGGKFSAEWLPVTRIFAYSPCRVFTLASNKNFLGTATPKERYEYGNCPIADVFFVLGDLIDIQPILESYKEYYGPANQVISLTPKSDEVLLKRETKSKVFDIRAYSDVMGLGEKDPNGLVQFEARKKFFLLEDKRMLFNPYTFWGGLAYIEVVGRLSKIDKNNRYLIPDTLGSAANLAQSNAKILNLNTLDLFRYQTHSLNLSLNGFHFNFPQVKLSVYLDAKAGWYQTSVSDSLIIKNGKLENTAAVFTNAVNVIPYGGSIMFKYSYSSATNIMFSYGITGNRLLDNRYLQHDGRFLHAYSIDGVFRTSPKSSFFARASFTHQNDDARFNFFQCQLGIVLDIFKTKEPALSQ